MSNADTKTIEVLIDRMRDDMKGAGGLAWAAVMSIAEILERAIGAPIAWPSRVAGAHRADELYPGDPSRREAFNAGVKWAIEQYGPTIQISKRFG